MRIIPARAGPTRSPCRTSRRRPDHPRSCGANRPESQTRASQPGSSPLVRGQPRLLQPARPDPRIIPARAGPTQVLRITTHPMADHPRSCGANSSSFFGLFVWCGSSPLVRGQQRLHERAGLFFRIIPARAGPTAPCVAAPRARADHPRSCGANVENCKIRFVYYGSSPLVRGQPASAVAWRANSRIIPARAGPTGRRNPNGRPWADHPRSCGANFRPLRKPSMMFGSSPLVRGQPFDGLGAGGGLRIIPARAGPTTQARCRPPATSDHPRSCGANLRRSG